MTSETSVCGRPAQNSTSTSSGAINSAASSRTPGPSMQNNQRNRLCLMAGIRRYSSWVRASAGSLLRSGCCRQASSRRISC